MSAELQWIDCRNRPFYRGYILILLCLCPCSLIDSGLEEEGAESIREGERERLRIGEILRALLEPF